MKNKNIDFLVEATLSSMDEQRPVAPPPFLLTRILSRLQAKVQTTIWERLYGVISKPAVAMGLLIFVVVVNSLIIFYSNKSEANNFAVDTSSSDLQSFTVLNNTAYYDVENITP